jgi:hypothetical protein
MSPLFRSPVLSALARTRIQRPAIQQFRTYAAVRAANAGAAAGPGWAAQWKKVGGSAMMYVNPYPFPILVIDVEGGWMGRGRMR